LKRSLKIKALEINISSKGKKTKKQESRKRIDISHPIIHVNKKARESPSVDFSLWFVMI
jgi:hypothetical protein